MAVSVSSGEEIWLTLCCSSSSLALVSMIHPQVWIYFCDGCCNLIFMGRSVFERYSGIIRFSRCATNNKVVSYFLIELSRKPIWDQRFALYAKQGSPLTLLATPATNLLAIPSVSSYGFSTISVLNR